jgi:hypothetical protein
VLPIAIMKPVTCDDQHVRREQQSNKSNSSHLCEGSSLREDHIQNVEDPCGQSQQSRQGQTHEGVLQLVRKSSQNHNEDNKLKRINSNLAPESEMSRSMVLHLYWQHHPSQEKGAVVERE